MSLKRVSIFCVAVLVSCLFGWWYLANEFEKKVNLYIETISDNYSHLINFDKESLSINKYNLSASLNNVTVFPKNIFVKTQSDKISICFDPLADKVIIKNIGEKLRFSGGNTEIYIPSPDHIISFDRSILLKKYDDFEINISSKESSSYLSETNELISKVRDFNLTLSNNVLGMLYDFNISLNSDLVKVDYLVNTDFTIKYIEKIESLFNILSKENYVYNLLNTYIKRFKNVLKRDYEMPEVINYISKVINDSSKNLSASKLNIRINKNAVEKLINLYSSEQISYRTDLAEFFEQISSNRYSFFLDINQDSGFEKLFFKVGLNKNKTFDPKLQLKYKNLMSAEQKAEFSDLIQHKILKSLETILNEAKSSAEDANLQARKIAEKASLNNFDAFLKMLININVMNINFDSKISLNFEEFSKNIDIAINDFTLHTDSEYKNQTYSGILKIFKPQDIIDNILKLYNYNVDEMSEKTLRNEYEESDLSMFIATMRGLRNNIKDNGFDVFAAFHDGEKLEVDDQFVMRVKADLAEGSDSVDAIKINDKSIYDVISDERIIKFMENLNKPKKE